MWTFLAEIASPIEKVRLTLAARRYARHLGSQLRRAYGGGDEYTAAQIRVAVQKCRLPVRYITLGYAAFMAEEAFRAIADKRDWPEYMSLRALYFEWVRVNSFSKPENQRQNLSIGAGATCGRGEPRGDKNLCHRNVAEAW
jgi:hypothetical protein